MTRWMRRGALALAIGGLVACAQVPVINSNFHAIGTPPGASGGQGVTFSVEVDAKAFSDQRPLKVQVWDAEQLAIQAQTGNCTVSFDARTGQETVSCPPGVTYRKATPEEFTVTRAQLAKGLTVHSTTVKVGQRYRVSVGGLAADNCNTAGASAEGVASAPVVALKDLQVAQTMMACEQPPR